MLNHVLYQAPTGLRGDKTADTIVFVISLVVLAGLLLWGLRKRDFRLIGLLIGAGLAGFVEAQLDLLSRIWWASDLPTAYTVFGRPIPTLVLATYSLAIGGGMYLVYRICAAGAKRTDIIRLGVVLMVAESVFEMILMTTSFYKYYGPQPLRVFGFPLYWGAINSVSMVAGGVGVYAYRERLTGRAALLTIAIPPLAFGLDFAVGWPTWDVMNTHASQLTMSLVSLSTIALCGAELYMLSWVVERSTAQTAAPIGSDDVAVRQAQPALSLGRDRVRQAGAGRDDQVAIR